MSTHDGNNGQPQSTPVFIQPECIRIEAQSQYVQPEYSPAKITGYGLMSIMLAPMGCCCAVPSVIGLIIGIIGLKKYKRNILCIMGIILCTLVILYFGYYTVQNFDQYKEMFEWAMDSYGQMETQAACRI